MTGQSERKNLSAVRERDTIAYMIKVFRWCREKERYIQRKHKNPGEAIAVGIILIGGMALIYWFMLYGMWALSIKRKMNLQSLRSLLITAKYRTMQFSCTATVRSAI